MSGNICHLNEVQQGELKAQVKQQGYSRIKDVVKWVEQRWAVHYSEDGMRELLHNLGFSYQKRRIVPCKAKAEAQTLFFEGDF